MKSNSDTISKSYACKRKEGTNEDGNVPLDACPHCGVKISDPRELLIHIFHCHPT